MHHVHTTLQHADPQRLAKAAQGLADGTLTVTVVHQDRTEVRALVVNGDGIEYTAVITAHDTLCGCKDWLYRGRTVGPCKHLAALALFAIQHPDAGMAQEQTAEEEEQAVTHYLRHGNQTTWCGQSATGLKAYHAGCRPEWEYFVQACPGCKAEATRKVALNGATNTVQSGTRAAA